MNEHGMQSTTDLVPLLADRGVVMTSTQVYRIVVGQPERLNMAFLSALCMRSCRFVDVRQLNRRFVALTLLLVLHPERIADQLAYQRQSYRFAEGGKLRAEAALAAGHAQASASRLPALA